MVDEREEGVALLGRQLAPALLERLGRADDRGDGALQLVRDECDEVGAQSGEPAELLDGRTFGLVGADVLHRAAEEAAE